MRMSDYTVGDLVAEFLERCGVDTAFGIISVHNIPILDAIARRGAIRFVMSRGEMGAGHMADGYARVAGKLGVLVTSTGPGAANACSALIEAGFAGSPVLHITGQNVTPGIGRGQGAVHDVPAQLDMLKSVSKAAYRVKSPGEALGVLTRAAVEALSSHPGPVSVEIPFDIQRTRIPRPTALDGFELPLPPARAPGAAELQRLVDHVAQARRPVLWLGNGARHAGAAATRLANLGFAVVNTQAASGIVPADHPMSLGALNGSREAAVQAFYETCDLIVVAGSRLRVNETREGTSKLPANLVHVDADPAANGRTYGNRMFVCADAALTLQALADALEGRFAPDASFGGDVASTRQRADSDLRDTLGPYASFPAQVRAAMPRDTVWVRDVTLHNGSWAIKLVPMYGPRDGMYPIGLGIGQGLPLGIGAALAANAQGRKVVMMAGDGGFAMNMQELWTAAQEKLDMVVLVMNDAGYGVIRHIQDQSYEGRRSYDRMLQPDYAGLAALAGMPFWRVDKADGLGEALTQALAVKGPSLVEVDMRPIGDIPPYVVPLE